MEREYISNHPEIPASEPTIADVNKYLDGLLKRLGVEEEGRAASNNFTLRGILERLESLNTQLVELSSTRLRNPRTRPYNRYNGEGENSYT